jgi:hypothetical protein
MKFQQQFDAACPQCGRGDMVGQIRQLYETVDCKTGEVVFRSDPEWTLDMECGACSHEWIHRTEPVFARGPTVLQDHGSADRGSAQ